MGSKEVTNIDMENLLEVQREQIKPIVLDCLREIFHHIPKGHKFRLSNGKEGRFETFFPPRYDQDQDSYGFGIDVHIDDFAVEHIEFIMKKTGQGGQI